MQHKHDPSERDHRTDDRQADPRDPLPRAKVQLLVPLVLHRARIDYELRVGNDHLERRARGQILDVIVRPPEPEERVRRVKRLVRHLRELRDLRGRAPTRRVEDRVFVACTGRAGAGVEEMPDVESPGGLRKCSEMGALVNAMSGILA